MRSVETRESVPPMTKHTRPAQEVIELAAECFAEDIPVARVLEKADVSWSTWTRWKRRGMRPNRTTLAKMHDALLDLIRARDERPGAGAD